MTTSIIVAVAENGAIGKGNQLPWYLPNDLKFFKNKTMGHHMIMGRKTYESIGKPLPGRTSIVVTKDKNYTVPGCVIAHSLEEAMDLAKTAGEQEVFVIGGAGVINESIKVADVIYLTEVKTTIPDADVYLQYFDRNGWVETFREEHNADEKHQYAYAFVTLIKKR